MESRYPALNERREDLTQDRTIIEVKKKLEKLNQFSFDLDLIYRLLPCEAISPYFIAGAGLTIYHSDNLQKFRDNYYRAGYETNAGAGIEFWLSNTLSLKSEVIYSTTSSEEGIIGRNTRTYITINAGLTWYFSLGEKSNLCNLKEKEVHHHYYGKNTKDTIPVYKDKPVLLPIHFKFNSAELEFESQTVLEHNASVLIKNPESMILISGHADSIGSRKVNQNLSKRRVDVVYNFLVDLWGIDSSRVIRNWEGEENPVRDNSTLRGRAYNRRVEFKIFGDK